jgi:glutamate/tyrosine decarboxylase-like PLP-dependent enzyme
MHRPTPDDEKVLADAASWFLDRLSDRDGQLPPAPSPAELTAITDDGIGIEAAWQELRDSILPSAIPSDHPRYLAFIPGAPTVAASLADLSLSAASVYAGSELEAGAVVRAERAALRWLADVLGLPARAHGTFTSGGSLANLSALVAARHRRREVTGLRPHVIVAAASVHSSIAAAADIMACELVLAGSSDAPLTAAVLADVLALLEVSDVAAISVTAGATNDGSIDDLAGISELCAGLGIWLHVDAAYGGAAMLSSRARPLFAGIERADSITVNPHKWLFTPYDCAAVLYRDPDSARRTHAQRAPYLETTVGGDNPSDLAVGLSRRARGIPLWMSLLANGTRAYAEAVDCCLDLADFAAESIESAPHLELIQPRNLSIVVFRRRGWSAADYERWSSQAIADGTGLVTPTRHLGAPAARMCFVNPLTTPSDITRILASLA